MQKKKLASHSMKLLLLLLVASTMFSCQWRKEHQNKIKVVETFGFESISQLSNAVIVNDFDNLLTQKQIDELSEIIFNYNIETTRQIAVFTVANLGQYDDIVLYATDLGNYLGVGSKELDNGLTIVLCNKCKKIGIATGTGTQEILTNELVSQTINDIMIPHLKKQEHYLAIKFGIENLIKKWD